MSFATVSDLKVNASKLDFSEGPITITQNGMPAYVVQSYGDFKRQSALEKKVLADFRRQRRAFER
jgi:PHD/YefM family antitoxin component YafN of YafNO toxin-antitoxin module